MSIKFVALCIASANALNLRVNAPRANAAGDSSVNEKSSTVNQMTHSWASAPFAEHNDDADVATPFSTRSPTRRRSDLGASTAYPAITSEDLKEVRIVDGSPRKSTKRMRSSPASLSSGRSSPGTPKSVASDTSSVSEHVEVSTVAVDGNEGGAMLRVLFTIARECEGVTDYSDGIRRGRNHVFGNWEWFARTALWPLALQVLSLVMLYQILKEKFEAAAEEAEAAGATAGYATAHNLPPLDGSRQLTSQDVTILFEHIKMLVELNSSQFTNVSQPAFTASARPKHGPVIWTMAMLTLFTYQIFGWFCGPLMKAWYCVTKIRFDRHPDPIRARLGAYGIFSATGLVGIVTAFLGWVFLVYSESKEELLLNAVALLFVFDIEESIAKYTANIGLMHEIQVPEYVVLPKYIYDPRWFLNPIFFWSAMFFQFLFLVTPFFPFCISFVAYYTITQQWTPWIGWSFFGGGVIADVIVLIIAIKYMKLFVKEGTKDVLQNLFDQVHDDLKKLGGDKGEDLVRMLYEAQDDFDDIDFLGFTPQTIKIVNDWSEVEKDFQLLLRHAESVNDKAQGKCRLDTKFGIMLPLVPAIRQLKAKLDALREKDFEFTVQISDIPDGAITISGAQGRKGYITAVDEEKLTALKGLPRARMETFIPRDVEELHDVMPEKWNDYSLHKPDHLRPIQVGDRFFAKEKIKLTVLGGKKWKEKQKEVWFEAAPCESYIVAEVQPACGIPCPAEQEELEAYERDEPKIERFDRMVKFRSCNAFKDSSIFSESEIRSKLFTVNGKYHTERAYTPVGMEIHHMEYFKTQLSTLQDAMGDIDRRASDDGSLASQPFATEDHGKDLLGKEDKNGDHAFWPSDSEEDFDLATWLRIKGITKGQLKFTLTREPDFDLLTTLRNRNWIPRDKERPAKVAPRTVSETFLGFANSFRETRFGAMGTTRQRTGARGAGTPSPTAAVEMGFTNPRDPDM